MIRISNILSALEIISKKLDVQNIKWIVVSSCGLKLHGLEIEPKDIDILTDKKGLLKINQILKEYEIEPIKNVPSEILNSFMSKFLINGCHVDAMCDFKIKSRVDNRWHEMEKLLDFVEIIEIGGIKIPILSLEEIMNMYQLMGREKDLVKVFKIQQFLIKRANCSTNSVVA